jgi:hypothetical protein
LREIEGLREITPNPQPSPKLGLLEAKARALELAEELRQYAPHLAGLYVKQLNRTPPEGVPKLLAELEGELVRFKGGKGGKAW